jgi:hypothetical protein
VREQFPKLRRDGRMIFREQDPDLIHLSLWQRTRRLSDPTGRV